MGCQTYSLLQQKMIKLAVLAILNLSGVLSKLDCKTPVVCDPSLESDIFLGASHFVDELACQTSCTIGHPSNPCKFFTFVPGAQDQVPNCYKMKQCNEMSKPIVGSVSGAWSCEDPEIFCDAIGDMTTIFILMETKQRKSSKTPLAGQHVPVSNQS